MKTVPKSRSSGKSDKSELVFYVEKDKRGRYSILTKNGGVSGLDEAAVKKQVERLKKQGKRVKWNDK